MNDANNKNKTSYKLNKRSLSIALGLMFILNGIFFGLINIGFFNLQIKEVWPISIIFAGISFFVSDILFYKRIRSVLLFPSVVLFILGIIFLLFSTHIFNVPFKKFISVFWPLVLLVFGIVLILLYVFQRVNDKDFPYMNDDSTEAF